MASLIDIKRLRIDGGMQHRAKINPELIAQYCEAYLEDKKLPPVSVVFDGTHYWVWDGWHRIAGAIEAGRKGINIDVKRGTQEEAFDLSLSANGAHGSPRTPDDKRNAVKAAMQHERHADKSAREIALLCDVSHTFVSMMMGKTEVVKPAKPTKKSGNVASKKTVTGNVASDSTAEEGAATAGEKPDDDPAPVKVTRPKTAVVGSLETISLERDEYKAKVIEMGDALADTVAELKVFEAAHAAGSYDAALRAENAALRKRIEQLEEANYGHMEKAKELTRLANHWKKKASGK